MVIRNIPCGKSQQRWDSTNYILHNSLVMLIVNAFGHSHLHPAHDAISMWYTLKASIIASLLWTAARHKQRHHVDRSKKYYALYACITCLDVGTLVQRLIPLSVFSTVFKWNLSNTDCFECTYACVTHCPSLLHRHSSCTSPCPQPLFLAMTLACCIMAL